MSEATSYREGYQQALHNLAKAYKSGGLRHMLDWATGEAGQPETRQILGYATSDANKMLEGASDFLRHAQLLDSGQSVQHIPPP